MGHDKGLICLRNRPFVQIAAELLGLVCDRVFLLAPQGRYPFLDLPRIPDRFPDGGPLVALLSGLEQSQTEFNLFLPCDMPFLTREVLVGILSLAEGADAVVPRDEKGRWFPLSAGYRKTCIRAMEARLASGSLKVDSFFSEIVVRPLPAQDYPEATFANINSPGELAETGEE